MAENKIHFDKVTLLITHYNRSKSLERLLEAYAGYNFSFYEIIVSDDGSNPEHIAYIENLMDHYSFRLIKTPANKGLGNNINKGQDQVKSEYTLYVQEDFIPMPGFQKPLADGLRILQDDSSADTVRFYAYIDYPKLKYYRDGFSEMVFDVWSADTNKFHLYSDHPHLRRTTFLEKFGRYDEHSHSDKTEFKMMISFLQQKGKGYLYNDYRTVFEQVNTAVEPSTVKRDFWRNNNSIAVRLMRYFYRQYNFNYNFFFKKMYSK